MTSVYTHLTPANLRQAVSTLEAKKPEAQAYLSKTLIEIREGTFVDPTPLDVREYLNKWLESAAKPKVSERTFAEYSALLKRYVLEPLGKKNLSDLRPLDIQSLYSNMLAPQTQGR
jgi:hypothetical protein